MLKFISGLALGYGVGLLLAPASGAETRRRVIEEAKDFVEAPEHKLNEALDAVPEKAATIASNVAREAAQRAVGKVRSKTGLKETGTSRK